MVRLQNELKMKNVSKIGYYIKKYYTIYIVH